MDNLGRDMERAMWAGVGCSFLLGGAFVGFVVWIYRLATR